MEGSREHRRKSDGRSYPPAGVNPAEEECIEFMGYLKGKSALMIYDRHANLKYKIGNRHFWSRGYYVSTVGLNEATIAKYVREQEKHDQMMDRISMKEAEDPL
jgi:putative transposase